LLAVAAAVVLAACGSNNSSSSSNSSSTPPPVAPASTTANAKQTAALVAAAKCIRGQGINIPDPGSTTGSQLSVAQILAGYPHAKVLAAEKACDAQIRAANPAATTLTPAQRQLRLKVADIFAACMRAHGINFPDPASAAKDPTAFYQALQKLPTGSPAYKTAGGICRTQALKETGG
jgi:hypothetical protein